MKSKYSPIIKVKKQGLDKAELDFAKAKTNHQAASNNEQNSRLLYQNMAISKAGTIQNIRADLQLKEIARQDLLIAQNELQIASRELGLKEALYKKAFLDFEKMKYLELEELKKYKKKLDQEEAKFLDEIAISRFFKDKDE